MLSNGRSKKNNSNGMNSYNVSPTMDNSYVQVDDLQEIDSLDVTQIVDSSSEKLINEINSKNKKILLWPFTAIVSILFINSLPILFAILAIASIFIYYFIDIKRKAILMIYDIDEETESKIQGFYDTFDEIMNCNKIWHIEAEGEVQDRKRYAGANNLVRRKAIIINYSLPKYVRTNVRVPKIPVGKQTLYLFPDKVLVYDNKKVGAVNYRNIVVECNNTRFIEQENVPKDATVVDQTWKYVNKNGGPDKRFSNNKILPIVVYSDIHFKSSTGLNEMIEVSKPDIGEKLSSYIKETGFKFLDVENY